METTVWTVFVAALITAIMTGVGALPFFFIKKISPAFMKISNAIASGLLLAACYSLVVEGAVYSPMRVIIGMLIGFAAILLSKKLISNSKGVKIADLSGSNAIKALLILGIMTAHSFGEGIGIGVAYGGDDEALGAFITTAIALHNIPEGLAISLVLIPKGTPTWKAVLWSIFTSLPQPLMAVPSFLFVQVFKPFLPVGLGIAAGAMFLMVFAELLPESLDKKEDYSVGIGVTLAFIGMLAFQYLVLQ